MPTSSCCRLGCSCSSPCNCPYGCPGYGCPGVRCSKGGACVCPCPLQPARGCSSSCACMSFWGHCGMEGTRCNPCCDAVTVKWRAMPMMQPKFKPSPSRDFCCVEGVPGSPTC